MHYLCEGHKHRCATEMKCRSVGADAKVWTTTNTMKLYHNEMSPPSRAVLLTAKALGIEMETQEVDLDNQENLTPEFLEVSHCAYFFDIGIIEVWMCFWWVVIIVIVLSNVFVPWYHAILLELRNRKEFSTLFFIASLKVLQIKKRMTDHFTF